MKTFNTIQFNQTTVCALGNDITGLFYGIYIKWLEETVVAVWWYINKTELEKPRHITSYEQAPGDSGMNKLTLKSKKHQREPGEGTGCHLLQLVEGEGRSN